MQQRIVVVDDEPGILEFVQDALTDEGYDVEVASNGIEVFDKLHPEPDLIVLDVMMPGLDGWQVCQAIRDRVDCPILFLSARGSVEDRIKGLMAGGDDYLVKPFSMAELKARIRAHLRREERREAGRIRSVVQYGDVRFDATKYQLYVGHREVSLTPREFEIVQLLLTHTGQVFSREQIYEKVWGYEAEGDSATVTEHIKKIRAKLAEAAPDKKYIKTVWGVGYKWQHPPA